MKTKTIEVELYTNIEKSAGNARIYKHSFLSYEAINREKIKVTYEIEEPTIEITPSRLREVLEKVYYECEDQCEESDYLIRELFGEIYEN